jgi:hypothetical protein
VSIGTVDSSIPQPVFCVEVICDAPAADRGRAFAEHWQILASLSPTTSTHTPLAAEGILDSSFLCLESFVRPAGVMGPAKTPWQE